MVLEFLANGLEEIEALTPVDILRRAGVEVVTVSITDERIVLGAHGIPVVADKTIGEIAGLVPELVILPGGMPGAKNLDESPEVDAVIRAAYEDGRMVAAICAAPMILGKRGMLKGRRATCYPGFEEYLDGAILTGGRVEADGNTITACGMGAALEFALALCERLKGEGTAKKLAVSVLDR